jgi:spore coat protein H
MAGLISLAALRTGEGAILKPVTRDLFAYLGDDWSKCKQMYDPETSLSDRDQRRVIQFAKSVTSASDAEFAAKLGDSLDLEEFARFMSVTVWLSTMDSILAMGQNFYVHLGPRPGKFQFLPWDLDHSFGQFPMGGSQEQRENLSILQPWRGDNRFLARVFKVEAFKELYLARMTELSKTLCLPERFAQQVDQLAAVIRPAVKEESETKLARFDKAIAGESVEGGGFGRPLGDGLPDQSQDGGNRAFGGPNFGPPVEIPGGRPSFAP